MAVVGIQSKTLNGIARSKGNLIAIGPNNNACGCVP